MSMLARYKKGGAIIELVKLIEDSGEPKRSQLLNMVRTEDPQFAAQVEARIFNFDKLKALPEAVLAEIVATTSAKFVALAIFHEKPDFQTLCERCLGKNFGDYKAEKDALTAAPPTPTQVEVGQRKMINEARKLENAGSIKLSNHDADVNASLTSPTRPNLVGTAVDAPQAEAHHSGLAAACPAIETFNLQPPPPGLSGERFETFIKSNIGK